MLLAQIPLSSSQRNISDEYKAKMYVRIAMLYLEAEDEVSADTFVGRSHPIVGKPDFNNLEVKGILVDAFTCFRILVVEVQVMSGFQANPGRQKLSRAHRHARDPLTGFGIKT